VTVKRQVFKYSVDSEYCEDINKTTDQDLQYYADNYSTAVFDKTHIQHQKISERLI